jgi:hypothetical protein
MILQACLREDLENHFRKATSDAGWNGPTSLAVTTYGEVLVPIVILGIYDLEMTVTVAGSLKS